MNQKKTRIFGTRLTALVMTLLLICSVLPFAGAVTQEDIDALKSQQAELKSQMSSIQSQISDLEDQEDSALSQALLYQQQMGLLTEQIMDTEAIIADYEEQILQTQADLAEAQQTEEDYYELFCERVRDMEETGSVSYWAILFNAANFSDLLDRLNFIKDVINYDNDMVKALEEARDAVAAYEAQLEQEQADHEAALAELESQQADIEEASEKNEALLAEIRANEAVYADQLAAMEAENDELAANIVESEAAYQAQLEELRRQAEEEERRRQEAEERQRQEEEERRRQEEEAAQNTTATQPAETPSETGTSDPEPSTTPEPEDEPESEPTVSVPSSSIGASVVSYACQFIGNPYVYGGTSLTNGCDCSGFVMQVFAHFGYSLPHSSWSQRSYGTAVSFSDAQPGDLIFYNSSGSPSGGHVGIYIGNGQMVSALGSRYGICISSISSSKSGLTVRRLG